MGSSRASYHHGDLRAALLRTAERALEHGKDPALRELSRELGVSHTAPRRHFKDKQALLDALATDGFNRLCDVFDHAPQKKTDTLTTRWMRFGRLYLAFAKDHPKLLELMFTAKHREGADPVLIAASERLLSIGVQAVIQAQAQKEVVEGDPLRLSVVLLVALQGLVAVAYEGQFKGIPIESLLREVIQRLIFGLAPR